MLFFLLLLNFSFPFLNEACPIQSIPSYKNNSICYYLQSDKTDFIDAEGICINFGGHLTSVHDMFENLFLSEKAFKNFTDSTGVDFWFGANDLSTVGNWTWIDDTVFDFSDWDKDQPQNTSNCGAIRMQDGKWISDDCFKQKPFVCLVYAPSNPITVEPTTNTTTIAATTSTTTSKSKVCPPSWTLYHLTQFCYKVFDNSTWQDAENRCRIDNSHLASIHTFEEAAFVADLAYWPGAHASDGAKQAWIGLFTEDNNTHWQWTDGTKFDYPNWWPGNPDNPGIENCVEILLDSMFSLIAGEYNNFPCSTILSKFICKKSPS